MKRFYFLIACMVFFFAAFLSQKSTLELNETHLMQKALLAKAEKS